MNRPEQLALALAAAVLSYQVFLPPVVGLANNGDFGKIAGVFQLGPPLEGLNTGRYSYTTYVFDQKFYYRSDFASSESVLLRIALSLNSVLSKTGTFDLRLMGAVHAAVFLLTLYLLFPVVRRLSIAVRWVVLLPSLVGFTDVMYVSYFNSLYMDSAAFLFLLLAIVLFLRTLLWHRASDRWALLISVIFLITSKTQHYPLGVLIAILFAWKGALLTATRQRSFAVISAFAVLGATAFSYRASPKIYTTQGCYSLIFFELLPKSDHVEQDLVDLGLDGSYRQYLGSNAYSEGSGLQDPEFTSAFARRMSYGRLAKFFLTHPGAAMRVTIYSMGEAGRQRPDLGNFDVSAGQPPSAKSRSFSLWSRFKARKFGGYGVRYLLYSMFLILGVPTLSVIRRASLPDGIPAGVALLAVMTATELTVASLADAMDYQRHFFIFNTLTDLLLISGAVMVALAIDRFWIQLGRGIGPARMRSTSAAASKV